MSTIYQLNMCMNKTHTELKYCKQCNKEIPHEKRFNTFCDRSCAATYNNLHSDPLRKRGPNRILDAELSQRDRSRKAAARRRLSYIAEGPYSSVCKSNCHTCGCIIFGKRFTKFCKEHANNYSHARRAQYWFTFYLGDYPELFDFSLLKQYGMRSKKNPNGVVRDHRISVADAIKNNYDPFYIKHPLNCELMLQTNNSKKHTRSSITYQELVKLVNEFEKNKVVGAAGNDPTIFGL